MEGRVVGSSTGTTGSQNCEFTSCAKPGGITPTTVYCVSLSFTTRPRIPGSAPNCEVHSAWLRSVTGGAPTLSSSAVKGRPSCGCTCSSARRFGEMTPPVTRSGSPLVANALPPLL